MRSLADDAEQPGETAEVALGENLAHREEARPWPAAGWLDMLRDFKQRSEQRLGAAAQAAQFALVGVTGMVVDLTAFALLLHTLPANAARAVAIAIAMTWNFWLNRHVTFAHARARTILVQYLLFCGSCALGALASWTVFAGLTAYVAAFTQRPMLAAMLGIVLGTVSNFVLSKYVAFK